MARKKLSASFKAHQFKKGSARAKKRGASGGRKSRPGGRKK